MRSGRASAIPGPGTSRKACPRGGFTLIEVMIVIAILVPVLFAVYSIMDQSTYTYYNQVRLASLQDRARTAVDQMAKEIRQSGLSKLAVTANSVTFNMDTGFVGGAITWGPQITYSLAADTLTSFKLLRTVQGSTPVTITRDVAATNGLTFVPQNTNELVITLTLTQANVVNSKLPPLTAVVQSAVRLRNL